MPAADPKSDAEILSQLGVEGCNASQRLQGIIYSNTARSDHLTQVIFLLQVNDTSKRVEYQGSVMKFVKCMADMPSGGQILMDAASFEGIKLRLDDLYQSISHGPDLTALQQKSRCASSSCMCVAYPYVMQLHLPLSEAHCQSVKRA